MKLNVGFAVCFLHLVLAGPVASANEATVTVKGDALVMSGDGTALSKEGASTPDDLGAFQILVKLPIKHLEALRCDGSPVLSLTLGIVGRPDDPDHIPQTWKPAIERQVRYYDFLDRARKSGEAITLYLVGSEEYLKVRKGAVYAEYCGLGMRLPVDFK